MTALSRGHGGAPGIGEALLLDVPDQQVDALTRGQYIHHGQYLIHGVLGRGSFATVYDAEHLGLARRVAIKVPLLHVDQQALLHERFLREARTSALVQHPNVLTIYDSGCLLDGTPFLVLERVVGESLDDCIAHGPLPIERVIEIGRQLARALSALSAAGIVHRDIKPANVMLHHEGNAGPQVKLVDLGVAKRRGGWQQPLHLTMQGELIGTPQYMAAEQLRGEEVDGRTDIYGAAAVLYEALTGKPPHESHSLGEFIATALSVPVLPIRASRPDCPASLERTLLRALARDRAQRQATAELLLAELEACKLELEASEVELDECELEFDECDLELDERELEPVTLDPVPLSLVRSSTTRFAVEPRSLVTRTPLERAPEPLVARAASPAQGRERSARLATRATSIPALRPSPGEPAHSWLVSGERALPGGPRRPIGLALLLLVFGGTGVLMLPGGSPPSDDPGALLSAPALDDAVAEDGMGEQLGAAVAPPLPSLPFAPRVEQLLEEQPPARRGESALPEPKAAPRRPVQQPREPPLVARESAQSPRKPPASEPVHAAHPQPAPSAAAPSAAPAKRVGADVDTPVAGAVGGPAAASARAPSHAADASSAVEANTQRALARALKAFAGGRFSDAEAAYREVLRSDARNTTAMRGLGLVAARLGETEVAQRALDRYLELAPDAPDAAQIASRIAALAR